MKNTKIYVALVAILVIAITGLFVPVGKEGTTVVQKLGAVSSLDGVDNPYVSVNGVRTYYGNANIAATSSVPCSFKNPFSATSTLVSFAMQVTTNSIAVAQKIDISTSSRAVSSGTSYGSSTPAFVYGYAADASTFEIAWSPGLASSATLIGLHADGTSDVTVAPSEYVTARIATSSPGTFGGGYYKGTCQAVFQEL